MPSDVIWAAIIAGSVGVIGNGATIWATQLQRRSHERTEAKRIDADADRLRAEHRETERQRRLATYKAFQVTMSDLDRAATWSTATDEQVDAALAEFDQLYAEIMLIGSTAVCDSLSPLIDALDRVGGRMSELSRLPLAERHREAFRAYGQPVRDAWATALLAMRDDIRRGYEDAADA
jgi:hypothetical protein